MALDANIIPKEHDAMISLTTARRVKAVWPALEPQIGDWYYDVEMDEPVLKLIPSYGQQIWVGLELRQEDHYGEKAVLVPTIDRMLAEIEQRPEYLASSEHDKDGYRTEIKRFVRFEKPLPPYGYESIYASPVFAGRDESVAEALIWTLEQEKQSGNANRQGCLS
jgi:hypothetical protein